MAELERDFPGLVSGPVKQMAIRNIERIRYLPYLLVGLIGVLAAASLAHALVLSVRRHRRQLAVCKTLGFTRRQVAAAIGAHASTLALAATAIGIPLGIVAGRWGWRVVADQLGVALPPITPLALVAAVLVGALIFANAVAAIPAWRAARLAPAHALRVE
jgi:putative ABC transport system permease protein